MELSQSRDEASGESGFTLVAFVVLLSIMSIMMGVAVQAVSFHMRREREAELIFRGEQYIEAIRLYKTKYGRSPMRLKELWEAKPKVLRRKWKDPMTDSMKWGLIFEGDLGGQGMTRGRGGAAGTQGLRTDRTMGGPVPTGTPAFGSGGNEGENQGTPIFPVSGDGSEGDLGNPTRMGPIIGVHSTSCEESIKEYDARSTYCEWQFIYRDRSQGGATVGGQDRDRRRNRDDNTNTNRTPRPTRTVGR